MACPTCDHRVHNLNKIFYCPRCGTVETEKQDLYIPGLVFRVRDLSSAMYLEPGFRIPDTILQKMKFIEEAVWGKTGNNPSVSCIVDPEKGGK